MRETEITRKTLETDIRLYLNLDGGDISINTGVAFFDHMLTALARHAGWGMNLTAIGDLTVDCHHTVEDVGIALGQALKQTLGDKSGIARYGSAYIPMDEALAFACLDISGRAYLAFDADFPTAVTGAFDCCMVKEFMRAVCTNAAVTLHIRCLYGANSHHMIEAMFKALAHAFKAAATEIDGDIMSTKGVL